MLQFLAEKPANIAHYPKFGLFGKSHNRSTKQGFGDVLSPTMAVNGSTEQLQPSTDNQRYTFNSQPNAGDIQHHPILPRPNNTGPICDTLVHSPRTMAPTSPFIFNARETTFPTTVEHFERDNQSPRDTEKPGNIQGG